MDAIDLHPIDVFRVGSSNDVHFQLGTFLALDVDMSSTRIVQRDLTCCVFEDGKETAGMVDRRFQFSFPMNIPLFDTRT